MIKIVNIKFYKGQYEYCGRPSILQNDYSHKDKSIAKYKVETVEEAISKFENDFMNKIKHEDEYILKELVRLRIKHDQDNQLILGCWCVPFQSCHCEIIKREILNLSDDIIERFKEDITSIEEMTSLF